jgi:hypothetical protein
MKKVILFVITLLSVAFLHAQTDENNRPLTNEEFFTQAEIVFEGYYEKTVAVYDSKGNDKYNSKWDDCYSIHAYIIQRIYKGADYNVGDRIFIVSQGGWLSGQDFLEKADFGTSSSILLPFESQLGFECSFDSYSSQIYFLTLSDFPDDINSKFASHKKYKYLSSHIHWQKSSFNCMFICKNKIIGLDSLVFHQREEFYDYMRQFEGFTLPDIEPKLEKQLEKTPLKEPIVDSLQYKVAIDSLHNEKYKEPLKESKKKLERK